MRNIIEILHEETKEHFVETTQKCTLSSTQDLSFWTLILKEDEDLFSIPFNGISDTLKQSLAVLPANSWLHRFDKKNIEFPAFTALRHLCKLNLSLFKNDLVSFRQNLKLFLQNRARSNSPIFKEIRANIPTAPNEETHLKFCRELLNFIFDFPKERKSFYLKKLYPYITRTLDDYFTSEVFCLAPSFGVNINPQGDVFPCCAFDQKDSLGSIHENTIDQIRRNSKSDSVRSLIRQKQKVPGCKSCYASGQSGGENLRTHLNYKLAHYLIFLNDESPTISKEVRYFDVQFSNLCNFRCRSCGPLLSSKWIHENVTMDPENANIYKLNSWLKNQWSQIEEIIPHVEEIYFWGGEPLIMPEHHKLLEKLLEAGRSDVKLRYSTNLSQLKSGSFDAINVWKKFKDVSIGASLDASEERGEYMRKEQNWPATVQNRITIKNELPQSYFFIACTTSAYNILHIPDFFKDWVNQGLVDINDFCVNMLQSPPRLSSQILPMPLKLEAKKKIENLIQDFIIPRAGRNSTAEKRFTAAIEFMMSEDQTHLIPDFLEFNKKIDELRDEKLFEVFPELKPLASTSLK